jgi:hypothetical protein
MPRFTKVEDGAVLDAATGLVWQLQPGPTPVPWDEALARRDDGWRLPGVDELVGLLIAIDRGAPFQDAIAAGGVWWSASRSPFAPTGLARAVEMRPGGPPAVVLRERTRPARCWRVRP